MILRYNNKNNDAKSNMYINHTPQESPQQTEYTYGIRRNYVNTWKHIFSKSTQFCQHIILITNNCVNQKPFNFSSNRETRWGNLVKAGLPSAVSTNSLQESGSPHKNSGHKICINFSLTLACCN